MTNILRGARCGNRAVIQRQIYTLLAEDACCLPQQGLAAASDVHDNMANMRRLAFVK